MVTVLSRIPHAEEAVHPEGRDPRQIESDKRKADEKKRDEKRDGTEASYKKAFEGKDLTNAPGSETPSPEQLLKESQARKENEFHEADHLLKERNGNKKELTNSHKNEESSLDKPVEEGLARREGDVTIDDKIEPQLKQRNWTEKEIGKLTKTEPTGDSVDNTNGRNEPALVYGTPERHIVVNEKTRNVVQISGGEGWKPDARIKWRK